MRTSTAKTHSLFTRLIAGATAFAFLFTTLAADSVQASFWEDRQRAIGRLKGETAPSQADTLYAQLPVALQTGAARMPSFSSAVLPAMTPREPVLSGGLASQAPGWIKPALSNTADLRRLYFGKNGDARVLLVQDAHLIYSAQLNIARFLDRLSAGEKVLVGVEGSAGAFNLAPYRAFPNAEGRLAVSDFLLKEGYINGPEYFGMTAAQPQELWGIETPALYDANVQAYRAGLPHQKEALANLARVKKDLEGLKARHFTPELSALDRAAERAHGESGDFAALARLLAPWSVGRGALADFLAAKDREEKLDFPLVERQRRGFIESLTGRLSEKETQSLIAASVALRSGRWTPEAYYSHLTDLAASKGVRLSAHPAFQAYVRYVLAVGKIDQVRLFDELDAAEKTAWDRLSTTPENRALVECLSDLRLMEKLFTHSLMPNEWASYEARRSEIARWPQRLAALTGGASSAGDALTAAVGDFEGFYRCALARNTALVDNLLDRARTVGVKTVVLVAGGFHSEGLEALLRERGISHALVTPRIEDLPAGGADYLAAFTPHRTPLEKLLLGEKLFLNPPSATAVATAQGEFSPAATAVARMGLLVGVAWLAGTHAGDLQEWLRQWPQLFPEQGTLSFGVLGAGVGAWSASVRLTSPQQPMRVILTTGAPGNGVVTLAEKEARTSGRVVRGSGQVGGVPFVLSEATLSLAERVLPEVFSAGLLTLLWGTLGALSPPVAALAGLLVVVGVRSAMLGSELLHGFAHALVAAALGGASLGDSLRQYTAKMSWRNLVPGMKIFLPGLSREKDAPSMPNTLKEGARTKLAALAGPLANGLVGFGLLAPMIFSSTGPAGLLELALQFGAGLQAWHLLASWTDYRAVITGRAASFFCGNVLLLGKRRAGDRSLIPRWAGSILKRMWRQIVVRGGQSGGQSILTDDGVVRVRVLNVKRLKLFNTLESALGRALVFERARGVKGVEGVFQAHGHARFATGGPSAKKNAHPFIWGNVKTKAKVWRLEGGRLSQKRVVVQNVVSHNGDFDAWRVHGGLPNESDLIRPENGGKPYPNPKPVLTRWLTRVLGKADPSEGDSPKIAGMMDLLLTQGQWGLSFRLAHALHVGTSPEGTDALTPAEVARLGKIGDQVFSDWLSRGGVETVGRASLAEVLSVNAGKRAALKEALLSALQAATKGKQMSREAKELWVEKTIDYFFHNDIREAVSLFMAGAEGTFGLAVTSSLYPGQGVLASEKQPLYIGVDPVENLIVTASEEAAVLAAGRPGPHGKTQPLPYLYIMRDGEIAHLQIGKGDAPNQITFQDGVKKIAQDLTEKNLAQWSSRMEDEGGRNWLSTAGNPYLSGGVDTAEGVDTVLEEMNDIPRVLSEIRRDWGKSDGFNRQTAGAFSNALLDLAADSVENNSRHLALDLLIVGAENNDYVAQAFAENLVTAFPHLNVKVMDSKEFAADPQAVAIGPKTMVLGISHSGQYFNTLDDVKFLQGLHGAGKAGPVFVMTGQMDTMMGMAVGQSFKAGAGFTRRVFTTGAGWRTAEPATVTSAALESTLSHLFLALVKKADASHGLTLTSEDVETLDAGDEALGAYAEQAIGRNARGQRVDSEEHRRLVREGSRLSRFITESIFITPVVFLQLALVFYFGIDPVSALVNGVLPLGDAGSALVQAVTLGKVYFQVVYFAFSVVLFGLALRKAQGRSLWDRFTGGRSLFIGDETHIHKLVEAYVRKLFSLSYGFAGWAEVKSGDPAKSGIDEWNPSVKRGDVLVLGASSRRLKAAASQMASTQLRGNSGAAGALPTSIAFAHAKPAPGKFNTAIVLEKDNLNLDGLSEAGNRIYETRVSAQKRLLAYFVFFHANAAETQKWTNRLVRVANVLGAPLFAVLYVLSLGKVKVWLHPWDISETQGRAKIFTTQIVPPIAVSPKDYVSHPLRNALSPVVARPAVRVSGPAEALAAMATTPSSEALDSLKNAVAAVPAGFPLTRSQAQGLVAAMNRVGEKPMVRGPLESQEARLTLKQSDRLVIEFLPGEVTSPVAPVVDLPKTASQGDRSGVATEVAHRGSDNRAEARPAIGAQTDAKKNVAHQDQQAFRRFMQKALGGMAKAVLVPVFLVFFLTSYGSQILSAATGSPSSDPHLSAPALSAELAVTVNPAAPQVDSVPSVVQSPGVDAKAVTIVTPRGGNFNLRSDTGNILRSLPSDTPAQVLASGPGMVKVQVVLHGRMGITTTHTGWVKDTFVKEAGAPKVPPTANQPVEKVVHDQPVGNPRPVESVVERSPAGSDPAGLSAILGAVLPLTLGWIRKKEDVQTARTAGAQLREGLLQGNRDYLQNAQNVSGYSVSALQDLGWVLRQNEQYDHRPWELRSLWTVLSAIGLSRRGGNTTPEVFVEASLASVVAANNNTSLTMDQGEALEGLRQRSDKWKFGPPAATFAANDVPVVNFLGDKAPDPALLRNLAVLLSRENAAHPPVALIQGGEVKDQLLSALRKWLREHREIQVTEEALAKIQWLPLGRLAPDAVTREGDVVSTIKIQAVLGAAGVTVTPGLSVKIVTTLEDPIAWSREGLPSQAVVEMVIGLLNTMNLVAPVEDVQNTLRAVRKTLTAA